ncbi:MAG: anthranilate synthase component I [Planctomycetota bacterium]
MSVTLSREQFNSTVEQARGRWPDATLAIPLSVRLLGDQLTPVLAYRRLVVEDERTATSFLFESVEGGERQGRHSILGAHPDIKVIATANEVRVCRRDTDGGWQVETQTSTDPLEVTRDITRTWKLIIPDGRAGALLPTAPLTGWIGHASYDAVRYAEPEKLPWRDAPPDDRQLPDLHFGLYREIVVFDHVDKIVHVVRCAVVTPGADADASYDDACAGLRQTTEALQVHSKPLRAGEVHEASASPDAISNMTREQHAAMVERAREYIRAGDIFQVVIGQRFERVSTVDPFDVYRALRVVNPSPYMVYLQSEGCILVASSPEILCRVRRRSEDSSLVVTNRPLAGTRRRGRSPEEDAALERELLADAKERAEHVMLVDLGRNDVGKVAERGTIDLAAIMDIERYSHVMHISSTVTGVLRDGLDAWDALRATLPVGTISGAPKIRAMQIIDELEPIRRGPYGGGFGYIGLDGQMDVALALRTIVTPTALYSDGRWTYHAQAAGGIVHDSRADAEYAETVNKAAALLRAIDLAEQAFRA